MVKEGRVFHRVRARGFLYQWVVPRCWKEDGLNEEERTIPLSSEVIPETDKS